MNVIIASRRLSLSVVSAAAFAKPPAVIGVACNGLLGGWMVHPRPGQSLHLLAAASRRFLASTKKPSPPPSSKTANKSKKMPSERLKISVNGSVNGSNVFRVHLTLPQPLSSSTTTTPPPQPRANGTPNHPPRVENDGDKLGEEGRRCGFVTGGTHAGKVVLDLRSTAKERISGLIWDKVKGWTPVKNLLRDNVIVIGP